MHIKFTIFQLNNEIKIPADKLPIAVAEKTIRSLNPWALNFSCSLQVVTNKLVPEMYRKFHPIPKNINDAK